MTYNKKIDEDAEIGSSSQYQVYVNDISWSSKPIFANYQGKKEHR